ncbi:MAG: hypothetical protein RL318_2293 [Fibrobacterota bacterium]|jgi:hypothetical protein
MIVEIFLMLAGAPACQDRAKVLSSKDGTHLYTEERTRTPCTGQRLRDSVRYLRPDGSILGTKTIVWKTRQDIPDIELRMDSPLSQVRVITKGDTAVVDLVRKGERESHRVELPKGTVIDAGIDTWLLRNLPLLEKGRELEVPVLIPAFHRVLTFSVKSLPPDPRAPGEIRIELRPLNWVARLVATPIVVNYRKADGHLAAFSGISDIKGKDGKNLLVQMRYQGWSLLP